MALVGGLRTRARGHAGNGGEMLAEDIDFYQIFKIHPTGMLLLTADLHIVDANDEFLALVGSKLEDLIGRNFYEIFPKLPEEPGGCSRWTALDEAMTSGRRQGDQLLRCDIEEPDHPGVFKQHWISTLAQPIRGSDGRVQVIEFSMRDITPVIDQYRALQYEEQILPDSEQ
jgi:PAS domain-containing protein